MTPRRKAGILALVLLAVGLGLQWWPGGVESYEGLSAACIRIGAVTGVLWLALPEAGRPINRWLLLGVALVALVVVLRPRLILVALLALAAIAILRPRAPRSPAARG